MATVTGIEFEIKGTAEDAINSIHKLSSALKQLNKIGSSDMGLGKVAFQIKSFVQDLNSIKNIKSIEQMSNALKGLSAFGNAMSRAAKSVESVNTFVDGMSRLSAIDFTNLNEAAASIRDIVSATSGTKSSLHETSTGVSETANSASRATPILNRLSSVLSSLSSRAKSLAKSGVAGVFSAMRWSASGTIAPIKAVGSAISGLGNRLKRLIIMRTFRAMIRAVTQAFKDGVNSLYEWSNAFGGGFASSMDRCSTALNYLKNSLGAVVAPIVNALAPALDFVVDKIVLFLNALNQLIAKLTGASYWTRAKKAITAYGGAASDAISGAGSAAKEAMRYLAPFDEINKFPEDSGSGGGGGGGSGSGATNASDLFEEMVSFDTAVTDFANMIKSAWEQADFTEVGNLVGTKLKNALDNINWSGIRETCNRIAHSIGTFINGFVETDGIWESIGSTVGEGINTAVEAWNTFFETVNFDSIGTGIATALNNALGTIDAYELGRALTQKLTALLDFAYGFVTTFDFNKFGTSVGTALQGAFDNINFSQAGTTLGTAVTGVLNSATSAINSFDWRNLGTQVGNFIKNIDWASAIGSAFGTLSSAIIGIGNTISGFFQSIDWSKVPGAIMDSLKAAITNMEWSSVIGAIMEALGSALGAAGMFVASLGNEIVSSIATAITDAIAYFQQNIEDCGGDIWEGIKTGISNAIINVSQWIYDNIFTPFLNGLKGVFGIASPASTMDQPGQDIVRGIFQGILNWIANNPIYQWIKTNIFDPFANSVKSLFRQNEIKIEPKITVDEDGIGGSVGGTFSDAIADAGEKRIEIPISAKVKEIIPDDGFGGSSGGTFGEIPVEAGVKEIKDNIPPKKKKFSGFDAELMTFKDSIDPKSKEINDVKAIYKTSKDGLSDYYRTLNVTGRYKSTIDSLSSAQKTLGTTSKWSCTTDALSSGQKTLSTTSKWSWTSDNLSGSQKTLNTTSRWSSVSDNLSGGQKTLNTTSNFKNIKNSLTDANLTLATIAKFAKAVDNVSESNRTLDAIARFTKSVNKIPESGRTIDALVKVTQGWKGSLEKALGIEWLQSKLYITAPKVGVNYDTFRWYNTKYKYPSSFYTYYARGGIMNAATLLGLNGAGAHIAGEAGQEAILPLDRNTEWMDKIADRLAGRLSNDGNMTVQVVLDGKVVAQTTADIWRQQTRTGQNPLVGVV